jgi:hypothetical protein
MGETFNYAEAFKPDFDALKKDMKEFYNFTRLVANRLWLLWGFLYSLA